MLGVCLGDRPVGGSLVQVLPPVHSRIAGLCHRFSRAYRPATAVARLGRVQITGMGLFYILLLTAFYVDNGKSQPLWRDFPSIAYLAAAGDRRIAVDRLCSGSTSTRSEIAIRLDQAHLNSGSNKAMPISSASSMTSLSPKTCVPLQAHHAAR